MISDSPNWIVQWTAHWLKHMPRRVVPGVYGSQNTSAADVGPDIPFEQDALAH